MKIVFRALAIVLVLLVGAGLVFYLNPLWVADQQLRFNLWREGVRSEYVEAGGYRLHYFEARPTDGSAGTPLLLVHGLGARAENWANMMPMLAAKGFHVYAPDLLGYGRSSQPDVDYSISMEEDIVVAFMKAVHLEKADVGGWSMGGWVVMKLALDHPERVDRLMIYDSAGIYFPATFGPELFAPVDQAGVLHLMKTLSPHPRIVPEFVSKAILRKITQNSWVVQRSMLAMMNGRDLLDFRLHDIRQPTLVVWGAQDELIPLSAGKRIHEMIPDSSLLVVKGCGHLAPSECANPVTEGTVQFLRSEPPMQSRESLVAVH
jgi:pimeloyl-ACP methyl ester carboxylesterase